MNANEEKMREALTEVKRAVSNDDGRLAMHARLIANAARDLAEAAERCVTDRLDDPWPKLPEIKPITTQLAKI